MEKRVVFGHKTLPYLLLLPQIIITVVFFFLPAGQAMWQSLRLEDAFGLSSEFVGLDNFMELFSQQAYLDSFRVTAVFSILVAVVGLGVSLLLAVMADRVIRGAGLYKTLLIWPYAWRPPSSACCGCSCFRLPSASWPWPCGMPASTGIRAWTATRP